MMTTGEERIIISEDINITEAVSEAMRLTDIAGFSRTKGHMVATAVSELARNIFVHAGRGEIRIRIMVSGDRNGIEVVAEDNGPGIADIEAALQDGFSTVQSLGLGLPGARRLMDEFEIDARRTVGTKITTRKWN